MPTKAQVSEDIGLFNYSSLEAFHIEPCNVMSLLKLKFVTLNWSLTVVYKKVYNIHFNKHCLQL